MGRALQRAFAFERAMHGAVGRVVTAAWGQAFLTPELDRCYDRNLLWIADGATLSAGEADAHAARLLGGHGMIHRRLMVEPGPAAALHEGLVDLGYEAGNHLFMVHDGTPPDAPLVEVVEAPVDAVSAATSHYLQTDPDTEYGRDPVTREHLLAHHREYGPAGGAERRFVIREGDEVVAWARLWRRGDEAQVEDVVCLADRRGRGYGRAVVAAATRAVLAEGAELVFIVADEADWPKDLYRRLGYETAGALGVYQRSVPS